jgi:NRAMP (natural resistance-associated macrophage protein)-like metal ion transporter
LITGAADDDPSGIATCSMAGAQQGTALLWTAWITWPLMGCVQMMCARIGMVTGRGLAGTLRLKFPIWLIAVASFALFVANAINIGADLAGMADSVQMLTGLKAHWFVPILAVSITMAAICFRYQRISSILKWLALSLLAYVITGIICRPPWTKILWQTIVPAWPANHEAWATLVALLGTTISPYLFYWQSSLEVEEKKAKGQKKLAARRDASSAEVGRRRLDVAVGTFASQLVTYFIILTTAITLHVSGATKVETSRQAAEALRPLAGDFAATLFAAGVIGTGLLAIPTMAGSAAYAFAETFAWRQGLDERLPRAPAFYAVFIASMAAAMCVNLFHVSPIQALYWSAIINGLLAPFLLLGILMVACDRKVMRDQCSSWVSRIVVAMATILMFGAAIGMFVF